MSSEHTARIDQESPSAFTALRRCYECGRTQDEDIRLQRCAGCLHVLYCSKSCQKKGWKTHRLLCRSNSNIVANPKSGWDQQLQDLGFESLSGFAEALGQWMDAHKWPLHMCADVEVAQNGGIDASQNPQKMLMLELVPRSSMGLPSTRNPSLMFQLKGRCLFALEDHFAKVPGCRSDWERGAPVRAAMNERFRSHPLYAGVLPILISVEGLKMTQISYFPQMRPDPMWLPGTAIMADARHIILEDILNLLVGSINEGFPLRYLSSDPLVPPLPGRYVRNHHTWEWQPLFLDWGQYRRGQHRGLDRTIDEMRFGFSPPELMLAFKSLVF